MKCAYRTCGGCISWQASATEIFAEKSDRLANILGLPIKNLRSLPSKKTELYRLRVMLRYHPALQKVGFFAAGTRELIDISTCTTAVPSINNVINWLRQVPLPAQTQERFRILLQQSQEKEVAKVTAFVIGSNGQSEALKYVCSHLENSPDVVLAINSSHKDPEAIPYDVQSGFRFHYTPGEFRQPNHDVNHAIRFQIREWLSDMDSVYDLYGGSGNLSLLLTRRSTVVVFEQSSAARRSAAANTQFNEVSENQFRWLNHNLDTTKWWEYRLEAEAAIVDPPRAGLSDAVICMLQEQPLKKLVYLSCNPISLAKDLAKLSGNYQLKEVIHADMMPRTAHIEALCLLQRK